MSGMTRVQGTFIKPAELEDFVLVNKIQGEKFSKVLAVTTMLLDASCMTHGMRSKMQDAAC